MVYALATQLGWGRGMKLLLGSPAALAALLLMANASCADTSYKECKVVSNSAEINFDETLTVAIYEHRPTKFCSFDVHVDPSPSNTTITKPAIAAARGYQQLAITQPSDIDAEWDVLASALIQALVRPWSTSESGDQLGTLETILAEKESETVRQCAFDAALKLEPFGRRTDVISCGIVEGGSFVIEAVTEIIRVVLILPGPSAG